MSVSGQMQDICQEPCGEYQMTLLRWEGEVNKAQRAQQHNMLVRTTNRDIYQRGQQGAC